MLKSTLLPAAIEAGHELQQKNRQLRTTGDTLMEKSILAHASLKTFLTYADRDGHVSVTVSVENVKQIIDELDAAIMEWSKA